MKSTLIAGLAALALVAAPIAGNAAETTVQIGRLACDVAGGMGMIVGSQKSVSCTFYRTDKSTETYSGQMTRIGLDIGKTDATHIEWLVFAATDTKYSSGALKGKYIGASGEATLGVGLGGNVLVGGLDRSFALQPFSVQAQTGLSLAAGLAELTLR